MWGRGGTQETMKAVLTVEKNPGLSHLQTNPSSHLRNNFLDKEVKLTRMGNHLTNVHRLPRKGQQVYPGVPQPSLGRYLL